MQLFRHTFVIAVLSLAPFQRSTAQSVAAPSLQVNVDASWVGLDVGVAVGHSPRTSFGASLGIGGNWLNSMVLAGGHFAEPGRLSYGTKDAGTSNGIQELGRASLFMRRHFDAGRQLDLGLKGSAFLHSVSTDDDPGAGLFVGLQATGMWWQWRRLRLGSQLNAGQYIEGSSTSEFGVNVAPVLVRVTFP